MYDDTMEVMQEEAADPEKAFAIIEKGMLAARSFDQEEALRIAKEGNLGPAVEELLAREKPNTIPTGFRDFDSEAGGLPRGGLTTIAASSGGGKSCMALQIAVNNFWRGNNVAIVTLEMSKEQMVGRLMANQSGVNYKNINLANLNDMQKARIRRTKDKMQKHTDDTGTRMDIFSMTDTTMSEIALQFRAFDYDLIEIDYINLLNKEDMDQKNEAQALGEIARLAKNQASATNAAWVVLAQLNEQGIVKYSRAIKEHSDYMLSWTYGDAEKESHIIEIDQQKSRNSAAFKFNLRENFKLQQFENVGSGETNSDVAVKKGKKKKKQERLPTAAPMPGMNFEDEDEDEL
jgi:predicted ATP-dependent serine protease